MTRLKWERINEGGNARDTIESVLYKTPKKAHVRETANPRGLAPEHTRVDASERAGPPPGSRRIHTPHMRSIKPRSLTKPRCLPTRAEEGLNGSERATEAVCPAVRWVTSVPTPRTRGWLATQPLLPKASPFERIRVEYVQSTGVRVNQANADGHGRDARIRGTLATGAKSRNNMYNPVYM